MLGVNTLSEKHRTGICTHFADNRPLHWVKKFFCGIKNFKRVLKSQLIHCDLDLFWPVYSHTVCTHHEMHTKHN